MLSIATPVPDECELPEKTIPPFFRAASNLPFLFEIIVVYLGWLTSLMERLFKDGKKSIMEGEDGN